MNHRGNCNALLAVSCGNWVVWITLNDAAPGDNGLDLA
jgi:hypothetical protein